jgi:Transposase DDE domain
LANDGEDGAGGEPAETSGVPLEFDAAVIVDGSSGRKGWPREARRQTDEYRKAQAWPVPRDRVARLLEAERRLSQNLAVEREANDAYLAYRAGGVMRDGRRFGSPPTPWVAPEEPVGEINVTDPDSRNVKTARGYVQGYNAQAAVNENHVVLAAEICVVSPDFGNLEPVLRATETELAHAGVSDIPGVVLADTGYWHRVHTAVPSRSDTSVLLRVRRDQHRDPTRRGVLSSEHGASLYRKLQGLVEPVFANTKFNRKIDRFHRRGRSAVRSEWRLITATHNLLRLHNHR